MLMYKKRNVKTKFFLFVSLFLILFIILNIRIAYIINAVAQSSAKYMATYTINTVSNEYLKSMNDLYQGILVKEENEDGSIRTVNVDIAKINLLQSEISAGVLQRLKENSNSYIKIPIASIFGLSIMSNWGPNIPLKVMPVSHINVKFEDSFTSAGINQTRLQVNLHVQVDMIVMVSLIKSNVKTEHIIPIAQIIMLGDVPNTYTQLQGVNPGISINTN